MLNNRVWITDARPLTPAPTMVIIDARTASAEDWLRLLESMPPEAVYALGEALRTREARWADGAELVGSE